MVIPTDVYAASLVSAGWCGSTRLLVRQWEDASPAPKTTGVTSNAVTACRTALRLAVHPAQDPGTVR